MEGNGKIQTVSFQVTNGLEQHWKQNPRLIQMLKPRSYWKSFSVAKDNCLDFRKTAFSPTKQYSEH